MTPQPPLSLPSSSSSLSFTSLPAIHLSSLSLEAGIQGLCRKRERKELRLASRKNLEREDCRGNLLPNAFCSSPSCSQSPSCYLKIRPCTAFLDSTCVQCTIFISLFPTYFAMYRWSYLQTRNRETDVENKRMDTKAGRGRVRWIGRLGDWHIYTTMYKIDN